MMVSCCPGYAGRGAIPPVRPAALWGCVYPAGCDYHTTRLWQLCQLSVSHGVSRRRQIDGITERRGRRMPWGFDVGGDGRCDLVVPRNCDLSPIPPTTHPPLPLHTSCYTSYTVTPTTSLSYLHSLIVGMIGILIYIAIYRDV